MTLQQLYCFESIARNLSFSKASSELFISQPAVTHHLRNLEKELNVTLIIRDKHSVILTEAGTRFLLEVNDILAQLETAKQTIQGTPSCLNICILDLKIPLISTGFTKYFPVFMNCTGMYVSSVPMSLSKRPPFI